MWATRSFKLALMRMTLALVGGGAALVAFAQTPPDAGTVGGQLKHGRYIGYIKLDERNERLAVVANFYLESPDDLTQFPRLNALFKVGFGGYNTHEYFTEIFEDIRYDFDNGNLTLDEPRNDITMASQVHTVGSDTVIIGQVFLRSSAVGGTLRLKWETDEPPDDAGTPAIPEEEVPFVPLLEGQYEGQCADKRAVFQVQTVRGLNALPDNAEVSGFNRDYAIVGRIAYNDPRMCGDGGRGPAWCTHFDFGSGMYNPYLGKLTLQGSRSAEECEIRQGDVSCRIRIQGGSVACRFRKLDRIIGLPQFYARQHHVSPTPEQRQPLPEPTPPRNEDLTAALRGIFAGWIHNETNDTYQLIRLNVMPFSSTNNPHNPNQMNISTTAITHFGRDISGNFLTQRYEPRSFYLRPGSGFTLNGADSDSFINVSEWKVGFIRGDFYSHAFGRVGTVQLVKGPVPPLPSGAKVVGSFHGEFAGPVVGNVALPRSRWFKLLFPSQPTEVRDNLVKFTGAYQTIVNVTAIEDIEHGTYDPYTGAFGWVITKDDISTLSTIASGRVSAADGSMKLFWPPVPDVFGARTRDYTFETYLPRRSTR